MRRVSLGGLLLDDRTPGRERVVTKLDGWGSAPLRDSIEDKAQQGGAWDGATYASARVVSFEGLIQEATSGEAQRAALDLVALSAAGLLEFVVDDPDLGPLSTFARVTVGADPEWLSGRAFTYKMSVKAPDELKYGPATFASTTLANTAAGTGLVYPLTYPLDYGVPPGVTPGAVTLPNAGTAAYWPRLRIDGPVPNPTVTLIETGDSIRFNGTVAAGQWLDIDCGNRRVLLNGQVSMRHLVSSVGRWLAVPVGGASLSWTADAADPAASLSAWGYEGAWL